MRLSVHLILLLILVVSLAAPNTAVSGPDGFDAEKAFYEGYFLQNELGQPEMALINYLKFLRAAPQHEYASKAATFCYEILEPVGGKRLADFETAYGHLVERKPEEPVAGSDEQEGSDVELPPWEPTTPEELLLQRYIKAAAQQKRPLEVAQAAQRLGPLPDLWRDGDFIEATRIATRSYRMIAVYRIAEMLVRKDRELDGLRKRLEVSQGFGNKAEATVILKELLDNEDAIQDASTEEGIARQIARLYPDVLTSPQKYGFLALFVGMSDPMDLQFRRWPESARLWLRDQATRPQMSEASIKLAVEAGRELQLIVDLLADKRPEEASVEIRQLWELITR